MQPQKPVSQSRHPDKSHNPSSLSATPPPQYEHILGLAEARKKHRERVKMFQATSNSLNKNKINEDLQNLQRAWHNFKNQRQHLDNKPANSFHNNHTPAHTHNSSTINSSNHEPYRSKIFLTANPIINNNNNSPCSLRRQACKSTTASSDLSQSIVEKINTMTLNIFESHHQRNESSSANKLRASNIGNREAAAASCKNSAVLSLLRSPQASKQVSFELAKTSVRNYPQKISSAKKSQNNIQQRSTPPPSNWHRIQSVTIKKNNQTWREGTKLFTESKPAAQPRSNKPKIAVMLTDSSKSSTNLSNSKCNPSKAAAKAGDERKSFEKKKKHGNEDNITKTVHAYRPAVVDCNLYTQSKTHKRFSFSLIDEITPPCKISCKKQEVSASRKTQNQDVSTHHSSHLQNKSNITTIQSDRIIDHQIFSTPIKTRKESEQQQLLSTGYNNTVPKNCSGVQSPMQRLSYVRVADIPKISVRIASSNSTSFEIQDILFLSRRVQVNN